MTLEYHRVELGGAAAAGAALVEVHDAGFGYGGREVVSVPSLVLRAGECLGIYGPNGSGKSTLVKGITAILPPLRGLVSTPDGIRFGYLPQHRAMESHWPMSAFDAAAMARSCRRRFGWISGDGARIRSAMRTLDVEPLARKSFAKLSGGQQQRVLLAGVLADEPQVVALDEPTEGLDVRTRDALLQHLSRLIATGVAIVLVSHEAEDLHCLCKEVAWVHPSVEPDGPGRVEVVPVAKLGSVPS